MVPHCCHSQHHRQILLKTSQNPVRDVLIVKAPFLLITGKPQPPSWDWKPFKDHCGPAALWFPPLPWPGSRFLAAWGPFDESATRCAGQGTRRSHSTTRITGRHSLACIWFHNKALCSAEPTARQEETAAMSHLEDAHTLRLWHVLEPFRSQHESSQNRRRRLQDPPPPRHS